MPETATSERTRSSCPECGYTIRSAIWCHDTRCCDPDLASFLAILLAEERDTGLPTFAVRFPDGAGEYSPGMTVRVWRAGTITPLITGPITEAQALIIQHTCPHQPATTGGKD